MATSTPHVSGRFDGSICTLDVSSHMQKALSVDAASLSRAISLLGNRAIPFKAADADKSCDIISKYSDIMRIIQGEAVNHFRAMITKMAAETLAARVC